MQHSHIVYHNPQNLSADTINKTVIWLHGLGADGYDFEPIVPHLGLDFAVKFIFPHAPSIPVTVNGGYVMPAWYDIFEMGSLSRRVDKAGIAASVERIAAIIEQEKKRGVGSKDIVVAGFSQGGAVAYALCANTHHQDAQKKEALGGLLALSTYFATADDTQSMMPLPVFIAHGTLDEVVSCRFAELAAQKLSSLGITPVVKSYPIGHQISPQEIADIGVWLGTVLQS